jgi:hypothetical protein
MISDVCFKRVEDGLTYVLKSSDQFDQKLYEDFISVLEKVYDMKVERAVIFRKYIDNIYGNSLLLVVYDDQLPVAIDAMWRNDLYGETAYQSCDTAILKEYRGRGIFRNTTDILVGNLPEDSIIYGFPNGNSHLGYIKMGWKQYKTYNYHFSLFGKHKYLKNLELAETNYIDWWLNHEDNEKLYSMKYYGKSYLLVEKKRFAYCALCEVDEELSKNYKRVFPLFLFFKLNREKSMLLKKYEAWNVVLYKNYKNLKDVPPYKGDIL